MNPFIPLRNDASTTVISGNIFVKSGTSAYYQKKASENNNAAVDWYGYTRANFSCNIIAMLDGARTKTSLLFNGKPCAEDEGPVVVSNKK